MREEESWESRTREALNELDELIWEYRKRKAANTIRESLKVHTDTLESGVYESSEPVLEETERQESTENLPKLEIDESDWDSRVSRAYERLQRYLDSEKNNPGESEDLELDTSVPSIMEIKSKEHLEKSIERHLEHMQYKRFDQDYSDALKHFEDALEERGDEPSLIKKLERLDLRDAYEAIHGMLPEVKIESMEDIDRLSEKYPDVLELRRFEEHRMSANVYFEVTDDRSSTEKELAERYNRSTSTIGNYRRRQEPHLLGFLRRREEDRVIREWTNSTQNSEPVLRRIKESYRENENPVDFTDLYSIERIERFDMRSIQGELVGLDTESRISETLVTKLTDLCERTFQDRFRVYLAEIDTDLGKLLHERRGAIELDLKERLNLRESNKDLKLGVVIDRLYIWTPDRTKDDMLNAWSNQYFYFEAQNLVKIVIKVGAKLELGKSLNDTLESLESLMQQMCGERLHDYIKISGRKSRILGEALHFHRDVLGLETKDFEKSVFKVTGANGVGGIENPKFLQGRELEIERTRLFGILRSDGWVSPHRTVGYAEKNPSRFDIVEDGLQVWGDVKLRRYYDSKQRGSFETRFPSPFYEALRFWGFSEGDKMMHNEGLGLDVNRLSLEAIITYFGELTPEDGSFDRGFKWHRSVVLDAGNKAEEYGFKPLLSPELVDLIKKHGTYEEEKQRRVLRMNELRELARNPDSEISTRARELEGIILANPSRLIEDEVKMASRLGIEITLKQERIRYSLRTGRVSVSWYARTANVKDTEKFAILCPPNDLRKKRRVKAWLQKRESEMDWTKEELKQMGIRFAEWWL